MLKAVRIALVALATLSTVVVAGPAQAGMVSTPAPHSTRTEREDALKTVHARLAEAGITEGQFDSKLAQMDTDRLIELAAQSDAIRAGNVWVALGVAGLIVFVLVVVIVETYWP